MRSPGRAKRRSTRSSACCAPAVMTTSSGWLLTTWDTNGGRAAYVRVTPDRDVTDVRISVSGPELGPTHVDVVCMWTGSRPTETRSSRRTPRRLLPVDGRVGRGYDALPPGGNEAEANHHGRWARVNARQCPNRARRAGGDNWRARPARTARDGLAYAPMADIGGCEAAASRLRGSVPGSS